MCVIRDSLLALTCLAASVSGFTPWLHSSNRQKSIALTFARAKGERNEEERSKYTIRRFEELSAQLGEGGMDAERMKACLDELESVEAIIDAEGLWERDFSGSAELPMNEDDEAVAFTNEASIDVKPAYEEGSGGGGGNEEGATSVDETAAAAVLQRARSYIPVPGIFSEDYDEHVVANVEGSGSGDVDEVSDLNEAGDDAAEVEEEELEGRDERSEALFARALRFYDPRYTERDEREKCYLVGLEVTSGRSKSDFTLEESLNELSELAGTAGLEVVGHTHQRLSERNARTFIGSGKVKSVKAAMKKLGCCTCILDDELSPGQQRNLESEFGGEQEGIKVIDRTALILDIFAQHARTREGQLQVELALTAYRMPRLTKLWTHLERQSGAGGVGLRGPGERQLEVDRRLLRGKMTSLHREIDQLRTQRSVQTSRRRRSGLPVVALVGYTNAGKSTLLNALTASGQGFTGKESEEQKTAFAENMLFATLDPTTRKVKLPGLKNTPEVLVTDTVGFIQKLPTNLVAAFRATLEQVSDADILVHVVDVSNPRLWRKQKKAVDATLKAMDMGSKPTIVLWNKADAADYVEPERLKVEAARRKHTVPLSAKSGDGMEGFVRVLETVLREALLQEVKVVLPFSGAEAGELVSLVHSQGVIDEEEYAPEGVRITAQVPAELANRLSPYRVDVPPALPDAQRHSASSDVDDIDWTAIAKKRATLA